MSAQIQRLERELGQPLLDRSRRTVRLTAAGEATLPFARAVIAAVADIHVAVEELTQLVRGSVTIGTVTSHSVDIPSLLADFHAEHPKVEITRSTDSSDALIEKVRTGRLGAAIVSVGPDERPEGRHVEVVTDEAIEAAVSRTDELASRTTIRLSDLVDCQFITLPVGAGIRHQFDAACASAGVTPRIALEASTPLALADLAERGLVVAIVPELRGRLVLAWRSGGPMSPAARVLVEKARRLLPVSGGA